MDNAVRTPEATTSVDRCRGRTSFSECCQDQHSICQQRSRLRHSLLEYGHAQTLSTAYSPYEEQSVDNTRRLALIYITLFAALLLGPPGRDARPADFVAIPEAQKPLYHFNFQALFYPNDLARKQDIAKVSSLIVKFNDLKPQVPTDPKALLQAIITSEEIWTLADRVQAFGGLRLATDTSNSTFETEEREGQELAAKANEQKQFILSTVAELPQSTLDAFLQQEPGLERYAYFLKKTKEAASHRAAPEAEAALAALGADLDPFDRTFRNLMIARSPNATIKVGAVDLNVTDPNEYAQLLRHQDRTIRKDAFDRRMATYRAQGDIFAYALFQKTLLANRISELRKFADSADEAYDSLELNSDLVDRVLQAFRDNAELAIRFQKAEAKYQARILHLKSAEPWDVDASPATLQVPQHTIDDAKGAVIAATAIFGSDYGTELQHLLDPNNGRMDIVPGSNRDGGDFTWGAYGPNWVFFMHGYEGQTNQVVTLAHEAAHAVHYGLLFKAGVPYYYGDGARYFVEACAKVNELLVLDTLAKTADSDDERLYYLRQSASKLASVRFTSMYWAAFATSFERDVVKRIRGGQLTAADEIHDVWGEYGRLWSIDFDRNPDLKYTWPDTHHFLSDSRRYAQYLFAWVVALAFYERAEADPAVGEKFVKLMERGFSDKAAVLLKEEMNIELDSPTNIEKMFKAVERRVAEFEAAAAAE